MNKRSSRVGFREIGPFLGLFLCAAALAGGARGDDLGSRPASYEPRVPLAKMLSTVGTLLVNDKSEHPWQTLGERAEIHSRDLLLALPGMVARLETQPRGVELILWGNLPEMSEFAGLQSAVILHDSRAFDLDFTLLPGRVLIVNRKENGAARVWLRVDGAAFQLTLPTPGDTVCVVRNSFWQRGVAFSLAPKAADAPAQTLAFLVVKGQADIKAGGTQHLLLAPPGPAYFRWDSINGPEEGTRNRRDLPDWADLNRKLPTSALSVVAVIQKLDLKNRDPRTALFDLLAAARNNADKESAYAQAEFSVLSLAAIDDIERVMQALSDPGLAAARRSAVLALRHWIGDASGRDQRLYQFLVERRSYTKSQAATVLQLLHDALAADEPDTYETLIAYLRHEKLAIRELAWWNLSRLVPGDVVASYDPAGTPEERAKAYAAWKKRIPSGTLPAREKK